MYLRHNREYLISQLFGIARLPGVSAFLVEGLDSGANELNEDDSISVARILL